MRSWPPREVRMSHHACYAVPYEFLDIVVVEDSRPMQMILRSMLSGVRARRVRVFDNGAEALRAMVREPPNLLVTDLRVPGLSGLGLIRAIRTPQLEPLCFVPALVVTAHATYPVVEEAISAGAHLLLVKPFAPSAMVERISWIINDPRRFVPDEAGIWSVEGVRQALQARRNRMRAIEAARADRVARAAGPLEVAAGRPALPAAAAKARTMAGHRGPPSP